jgi:hypothetical protein
MISHKTKVRFLLLNALFLNALFLTVSCVAAFSASAAETSLIKNGDFEMMQNGQPQDWSFTSASPEIFKLSFPVEKARGHIAQMDVSSAAMSGYFNQSVAVTPHTNYRLSALARLGSGKILIYLHGGEGVKRLDTRIYVATLEGHPLVPYFWDKKWLEGSTSTPNPNGGLVKSFLANPNQWQPVTIDFNSGELSSIIVSLGAYFESGQYAFDDVSLTALPTSEK